MFKHTVPENTSRIMRLPLDIATLNIQFVYIFDATAFEYKNKIENRFQDNQLQLVKRN